MTHSLYSKFILGYLVFGLLGFVFIATFSSRMTRDYLIQSRANTLYDEACLIASSYSTMYQGQPQDLSDASPQLRAVAQFLGAEVMVVNRQGTIIVDSTGGSRVHTCLLYTSVLFKRTYFSALCTSQALKYIYPSDI